jgi:hypothetical protein
MTGHDRTFVLLCPPDKTDTTGHTLLGVCPVVSGVRQG